MSGIKVLRIVNRFNLGGIAYNVSNLSKYLSPEFKTLLVGGPEENGELNSLFIPRSLGLDPVIVKQMRRSVNPFTDYQAYRKLRQLIREFGPQIVHTHASKAGALGRLAAAHCDVPVIVHTFHGHVFHGYFGKAKTTIYKATERYLAKRTNAIVAISESQKKELCEIHHICPPEKVHLIPLGFDLARFGIDQQSKRKSFRHEFGLGEHDLVICIIGRLAPVKNHGMFVRAAAKCMKGAGRRIRALIVGDGETRPQVMAEIKKSGRTVSEGPDASADFIFTGWRQDVDVVLAGADIVCLTSWNEGTPVSLIEAQAAGKFIVTTEAGGVRDILHPGCGLMSQPGDETSFTHNLARAISSFEQAKGQAGIAAEEVIRHFSYTRLCDDMAALYRRLLADARYDQ